MPNPLAGLPPRLLRTKEAARFLGISIRTLEKHRTYGTGPTYRKVGGRVLYTVRDLEDWSAAGERKRPFSEHTPELFVAAPPVGLAVETRERRGEVEVDFSSFSQGRSPRAKLVAVAGQQHASRPPRSSRCPLRRAPSHCGMP